MFSKTNFYLVIEIHLVWKSRHDIDTCVFQSRWPIVICTTPWFYMCIGYSVIVMILFFFLQHFKRYKSIRLCSYRGKVYSIIPGADRAKVPSLRLWVTVFAVCCRRRARALIGHLWMTVLVMARIKANCKFNNKFRAQFVFNFRSIDGVTRYNQKITNTL